MLVSHIRLLVISIAAATVLEACERDRATSDRAAETLTSADTVVPAVVYFVASFDEQGGSVSRRVPLDSAPGPYVVPGDIFADARGLAAVLAPESRVTDSAGRLTVDGKATNIDTRRHGTVAYVSVRKLARELRGYVHFGPDGRDVALWPSDRLCEYFPEADTRAEVYRGAAAEGLFAYCAR